MIKNVVININLNAQYDTQNYKTQENITVAIFIREIIWMDPFGELTISTLTTMDKNSGSKENSVWQHDRYV